MRNDFEGVAFDLDGTLYPNYRLNSRIFPHVLRELRLVIAFGKARTLIRKAQEDPSYKKPDDFYMYQAEVTAGILSQNAEPLKYVIERRIYRAWEPPFMYIKLFDGVMETLTTLKQAGYKLGLLSDFPPEKKLEYLGLKGLWDAVLCSECSGAIKPHPQSFNDLAAAMKLPPEKILYVGNSRDYDVVGASRAGMKTAWIKHPMFPGKGFKKPRPDFSFSNYRQLHDFMID
jgi:putative hydrolase of the HAD superfamily